MHISDVAFECAQQCARLSLECNDRDMAQALFEISARLFAAATRDAELVDGGSGATARRNRQASGGK